ncbi:hypothetical protein D3C76_1350840 [compost metagenome]
MPGISRLLRPESSPSLYSSRWYFSEMTRCQPLGNLLCHSGPTVSSLLKVSVPAISSFW